MICDKCGFEHNSKSVCPKCGARVVYVNEDYLKRRKEWEESQKNPEAGSNIPPGIMYSTREDYDRRHGNDRVTELNDKFQNDGKKDRNKGKGRSAMTGLSFGVIKEKIQDAILKAAEKLAAFIRKHKKRRGTDNPVIRELKFDDSPNTLDDSPAVVEHKIFHGVRKPAILIAAVVAGAAVIAVATLNIVKSVKNRDRSRIFIYDGTIGYYAGKEDEPIITSEYGRMTVETAGEGCFLAWDSERILIFRRGKTYSIDAVNADIVTFSSGLDTVVFTENGKTMVTDGKDTRELVFNGAGLTGNYTEDCGVSDNGKYIFLTTCSESEDFSAGEYGVYFGTTDDGMDTVRESSESARIVNISDDGTVIYEDMDNAAYGIVNGRNLMETCNGDSRTIAEDISAVQYDSINDTAYFIDSNGNLSVYVGNTEPFSVAEDVAGIKLPSLGEYGGGVIYRTGTKYFYTSGATAADFTTQYLFTCGSEPEVCVNANGDFWYYDGRELYHKDHKHDTPEPVITDAELVEFMSDGSYAYLQDGILYYYSNGSEKTVRLADGVDGINDIKVSRKEIYYIDSSNILYSVSKKGGTVNNLGQVEFITGVR